MSYVFSPISIFDHQSIKIAFGRALAQDSSNPFNSALAITGETGKALWVVNHWLNDSEVLEAKEAALAQKVVIDKTPTKNELIDELRDTLRGFDDQKAIVAGYKLLSEMLGITGALALKAPENANDVLPVLRIPEIDENPNVVFLDEYKSKTA